MMPRRAGAKHLVGTYALLLFAMVPSAPVSGEQALSPLEARGKRLYTQGIGEGEVQARLAGTEVELPASAMPCQGCHGRDGRGRPEGGANPSDLRWSSLSRPYEIQHPSGRQHGPYDERSLSRAISLGFDPAGNELGVAMPRYTMLRQDMQALLAYLRRLGNEPEPGLAPDRIHLGALLPAEPAQAALAFRRALEAGVEELNQDGGIYGRQLTLHFAAAEVQAARALLETDQVFALVGGSFAGQERPLARLVAELEVPAIGPYALDPWITFPINRQAFYLYPGKLEMARALARTAARRWPEHNLVVLHLAGDQELASVAVEAAHGAGLAEANAVALDPEALPEMLRQLRAQPLPTLLLDLPPRLVHQLLEAADQAAWQPVVLLSGPRAGRALLSKTGLYGGQIVLAYPGLPSDVGAEAMTHYRRLAARHGLPARPTPIELSSLASLRLLAEALRRSGHELSREGLLSTLEAMFRFDPGYAPELSYDANRRIGAGQVQLLLHQGKSGRLQRLPPAEVR